MKVAKMENLVDIPKTYRVKFTSNLQYCLIATESDEEHTDSNHQEE